MTVYTGKQPQCRKRLEPTLVHHESHRAHWLWVNERTPSEFGAAGLMCDTQRGLSLDATLRRSHTQVDPGFSRAQGCPLFRPAPTNAAPANLAAPEPVILLGGLKGTLLLMSSVL